MKSDRSSSLRALLAGGAGLTLCLALLDCTSATILPSPPLRGGGPTAPEQTAPAALDETVQQVAGAMATALSAKLDASLDAKVGIANRGDTTNELWPWIVGQIAAIAAGTVVLVAWQRTVRKRLECEIRKHSYLEQKPQWELQKAAGLRDWGESQGKRL